MSTLDVICGDQEEGIRRFGVARATSPGRLSLAAVVPRQASKRGLDVSPREIGTFEQ